ncbi:DNA polymerase [Sea otter poxvirus]|uniref:DNA polymerase n=3 Tax=Sea otter poxvirus TaxID=1416741 RepID=A0A2U9QHN6_9POXV|nr:DNA polymerase [Sea otter poxvirus]AWU47082.1 DNA polymerase [Sea otter poxvirus]
MDVRCLNLFENKGDKRSLFLKARSKTGESIFIRFDHYFYYVVRESVKNELRIVTKYSKYLGSMNILNIDEHVYTNTNITQRCPDVDDIWLLADTCKLPIQDTLMSDYLNVTWFLLLNNIIPDGCYTLDTQYLVSIRKDCYHCINPELCFKTRIQRFNIVRSCLFFDIECQFDKKFPSVFTNPISHISCYYIDKAGNDFKFTLINVDLLTIEDKQIAYNDYITIDTVDDMNYNNKITFCSEITLLRITKKLLEAPFDFIVSFNGHNFDIRYISTRLTLLTNEHIIFRLPDRSESVNLGIYERNLASHRGVCGMSNTTYHINNNNGTIFFDLYSYIQKSERLTSYKLDSIAKHAFACKTIAYKHKDRYWKFIGNETTDVKGKAIIFSKVLSTGNYITMNDTVYKIIEKKCEYNSFHVVIDVRQTLLEEEIYELSFGKDDIDLATMYQNFTIKTAIEMADYCLHDACLCYYLWIHYGIETKIDAAANTYILPQCLALEYRASTLIKGPLQRLLLETKTILVRSNKKCKFLYEGGKVFEPKKKIFSNNVIIFDYNSLYPNVCIYGNLSPETLVGVIVSTNRLEHEINKQKIFDKFPSPNYIIIECEPRSTDYISEITVFDRSKRGIIPKLLLTFLEQRSIYKNLCNNATTSSDRDIFDSMQYMYKIISNSVYGLMGFRNSTLYSYASAKTCTTIGRKMIMYLDSVLNGARLLNGKFILAGTPTNPFFGGNKQRDIRTSLDTSLEMQFSSIYGDTDSVFLEVNNKDICITLLVAKELEKAINSVVLFDNFKIEFEGIYKNLIMQSKKKYTTIKYSANYKIGDEPVRINKGTSETRRDVSLYHKVMIKKYKTQISDMLASDDVTSAQVCIDTLKSLEADLMIEFENRYLPLSMFTLSRRHHCNYKSKDNPNIVLVARYNSENTEHIEIGERYQIAYICSSSLPWQKKLTNIKTYERIIDKTFTLHDERILYEIYFRRLATEVVNLLDNKVLSTQLFNKLFGTKPTFYN